MSDFLTRLAQRSLGEPPAIRPRLPGLFAPLDEPLYEPFGEPQSAKAANLTTVTDAAQSMVTPSPPLRSRTTPRAGPIPTEPNHAFASPQRQQGPSEALAAASFSGIDSTEQRAPASLIAKGETAQTHPAAQPPLVTKTVPSSAASLQSSLKPLEPNPTAAAPEQRPPLLPRRTATTTSSCPSLAGKVALAGDSPAAEPTVHITIGRLEVRANMSTAPPAPRPHAENKPTLSLGDYLKRGGGRP